AGQYVVAARVNTECLFSFLYDNRDAVTAVATAFIAFFTFTLWWATWSLLRHGREVERALFPAEAHLSSMTRTRWLSLSTITGKLPQSCWSMPSNFVH